MKLLYVLYFDLYNTEFYGVSKKIVAQVSSMRNMGIEVDIGYCSDDKFIIEKESNKFEFKVNKGASNYRYSIYKLLKKQILSWEYDSIYFRYPGSVEYFFFNTLRMISKNKINIYLEMPTYPIGGEMLENMKLLRVRKKYLQYIQRAMIYSVHRLLSRNIYKYVKTIVTFMPYERIWKCKSVNIDNGINTNHFKAVSKKNYNNNDIVLLGVANIAKWHGFDRIIEGLGEYYKKKYEVNVIFNIVGSGELIPSMKLRVKELGIEEKVNFLGVKKGEDLKAEYEKCDIGVSSLGMHRIGLKNGSTLKTKEYCAYGIPFILAYNEKEIDDDFKYCLKLPGNDNAIDINEIVEFYNSLKEYDNISEDMNKFAVMHYDWKIQMKKVFFGVE